MSKSKKTCFVIMGFGKKTDPDLGKTYDLDKTYKHIIRPAVISAGFECVRADEIKDSGLIDKSMYAFLMQADLVIADITTFNPNAIYELGIRHGVRPYSTIILKEKNGKIPFDLDHNRMCMYSHLGEDIGADEVNRCKEHLTELIKDVAIKEQVDSPLYQFIQDVTPPILPKKEYQNLINELVEKEKVTFAIVEKARIEMSNDDFEQAAKYWEKASNNNPTEPYFIQQWALCRYKSDPSNISNLTDAITIISKLCPTDQKTNDPETLGITGAIYKNMWWATNDISCLDRAIEFYGKCFNITNDYYTGENYSFCLDEKVGFVEDDDEKTFYKISAKKARASIIHNLVDIVELNEIESRIDKKWIYATLSNCYLANGDLGNSRKYETIFLELNPEKWERDTFNRTKSKIVKQTK